MVEALVSRMGIPFKEDKHLHVKVAKGVLNGVLVHFLIPTNYMNRSGQALKAYMEYYKLQNQHLAVVVDDIYLPYQMLRLRELGAPAGHNGLKSIEQALGSSHYMRLRMGIGDPGQKNLADYVLENFSPQELTQLEAFVDRGADVLQMLLTQPVSKVMSAINAKVGE